MFHIGNIVGGSDRKESACNARDPGLISGSGRYPGEENGYPLQYSGLKFHGLYSPWGHKELDTAEHTHAQGFRICKNSKYLNFSPREITKVVLVVPLVQL